MAPFTTCVTQRRCERIAIGSGAGEPADADTAGGAADIVDDDGLTKRARMPSAMTRASISLAPPAGNGTMMVIGRVGSGFETLPDAQHSGRR